MLLLLCCYNLVLFLGKKRSKKMTGKKRILTRLFITILLTVTTVSSAGVWVDPNSFDVSMVDGTILEETLTIGNDSGSSLNFTIRTREVSREVLRGLSAGGDGYSAAVTGIDDDKIVLNYRFDEPTVSEGSEYDYIQIEGMEPYERTGAPIVPVCPVKILIPFGKKVAGSRVTALGIRQFPGTYLLPPAQEPYPLSYKGTIEQTEPDSAIYSQARPWPGIEHELVDTQSKRGYRLLIVNLFPVQYIPATGEISYVTGFQLEIDLADSAGVGVLRPSEKTRAKLSEAVDNPGVLGTYPSGGTVADTHSGEAALPGGGPYPYVIITSSALESASGPLNFQALRDHKIANGVSATIVTTEWIYSNYDGTRPDGGSDNQTRIRNFLIDAYQTWGTEYVLLGGTDGIVPARRFWVEAWPGGDVANMPVDMYYGCVEPAACTFDYDEDGDYGEPTDGVGGGDVDLYAEIYVGRAPVENVAELAHFINKTLTYASTYSEYLPLISMVGEHLGFGGVAEYAKPAMEQIRLGGDYDGYFTYGFENHTQPDFYDFDTSVNLYDADGSWPKSELISLMNAGTHVFNHLGHANYTYDMKLSTSDLSSLANTDYFFAYSQGCMPGGFDHSNCFAEVITTIEHGAFAAVMNARYGWGRHNSTDGPSQRFDRQFWDAVLNEDMLEMGRANQDSKEDNLWDINGSCIRWCYYELNLFGDPQQEFRFEEACEWLTTEPQEGTVGPGGTADVNVIFDALELLPGTYEAEIIIASSDPCSPILIPVTLTVNPDDLQIVPAEGFESSGVRYGPFTPRCKAYTLTNNGSSTINWTTSETESWLSVEPYGGVLDPYDSTNVNVCITSDANLLDPNIYEETLIFENINSGSIKSRSVTLTVKPPDMLTEFFEAGNNDLEGLMITFSPDGSGSYYEACREEVNEFPTNPDGGTFVSLWDDDYAEVALDDGNEILFYGTRYNHFYIGSNGYITFGDGDIKYEASFENHFDMPRISGIFADLNPPDDECISYKNLSDRVVVTFEEVLLYGDKDAKNSFQVEMFYVDGTICITWLDIAETRVLAGLSEGYGVPPLFLESDLSEYVPCWPWCDLNRDYYVNFKDFAILANHWLDEDCDVPYWCGKSDIDWSGIVDYGDVSICSANWLAADEWWLRPLSHWKFDEGEGDIAHDSAGDNDGTIYGATWTSGQIDGALSFDGNGDYVDFGDNSDFDSPSHSNALTISAWVYPTVVSGNQGVVSKWLEDERAYLLQLNDDEVEFTLGYNNGNSFKQLITTSANLQTEQWCHLAGVYNGSNMAIYVDGTFVDEAAWSTAPSSTSANVHIGDLQFTTARRYFNGSIDDVRIYDKALSAEEIEELYQEGATPKASNPNPADGASIVDPNTTLNWQPGKYAVSHDVYFGTDYEDVNDADADSPEYMGNFDINSYDPCGLDLLTTYYWRIDEIGEDNLWKGDIWSFRTWLEPNFIGWWELDESEGDTAYDSAGNNDGAITGATWTSGQIGGALEFDGANDYVDCGDSSSLEPNSFTISAWIKPGNVSASSSQVIAGSLGCEPVADCGYGYALRLRPNGKASLIIEPWGCGNANPLESTTTLEVGQWYLVTGTYEGTTATIYLNGEPENSGERILDSYYPNFYIGACYSEYHEEFIQYFDGLIDDVRLYDRVLSAGEIEQLYLDGLP